MTGLLSLPEEILQSVAEHFMLAEWARKSSLVCCQLHHIKLPRVGVEFMRMVKPDLSCHCPYHFGTMEYTVSMSFHILGLLSVTFSSACPGMYSQARGPGLHEHDQPPGPCTISLQVIFARRQAFVGIM